MKLVIGGYAQGKLNYVLGKYDVETIKIYNGELPENIEEQRETIVINHFQNWVKRKIACDDCPEKEIFEFVEKYPDCVIISDEVGNGIVVELAKKAEEVERVICGIGQKIK
jgi:adenosyl cobinamide kinase/adenosyl cobinamide phosphate guanylyltransferase